MKKKIVIIVSIILFVVLIVLLGPLDVFSHGFYPEEINVEKIDTSERLGEISINDDNCTFSFSPKKRHFAGFELYVHNNTDNGTLRVNIYDSKGSQVDKIEIELHNIKDSTWYKVYTNASLKKNEIYSVKFECVDTESIPSMLLIGNNDLSNETISGNVLVSYAYEESTFSFSEKVLISLLLLAVLLIILYFIIPTFKHRKMLKLVIIFLGLQVMMTWNYMYNSFNNNNTKFSGFQSDSEALVLEPIAAEHEGVVNSLSGYGLGHYKDGTYSDYKSQYGLQGKIFRFIARYIGYGSVKGLNFICAFATAMVLVILILLLKYKYNTLFAGCFYVTFLLSPWIVNFAKNLYWVEFTWFVPMVVGLIATMKINSIKCRIGCYVFAFISILVKCLCGYEYISCIMMGLIAFPVIDLFNALVSKKREKIKQELKMIVLLGVIALFAFAVAILVHASLRSDESIVKGIKLIFEEDVLRRTNGADLNNYSSVYWPSMNASIWEVFCKYFHFSTDVITGINGYLFPILCVIPIVIFIYDYKLRNEKTDYYQCIFMYLFFFMTAISWYCLAKSHSYIHTHMNYVLWYFGFVQVCFYIIISRVVNAISKKR